LISDIHLFLEKFTIDHEYLEKVKGEFVSTYHFLAREDFYPGEKKLERFIENSPVQICQDWRATLIMGKK
jgi:hypothetical protein